MRRNNNWVMCAAALFLAVGCDAQKPVASPSANGGVAVPAPAASSARPPLAVSQTVLDSWTKAGAKWHWYGPHKRSGENVFTDDPNLLDIEKSVSALEIEGRMIEGAMAKLPRPDKPFAVSVGRFSEDDFPKRARLLREASGLGKIVAFQLGDSESMHYVEIDELTLAVVATLSDLHHLSLDTVNRFEVDVGILRHLTRLHTLVLRCPPKDIAIPWVSALTKLRALRLDLSRPWNVEEQREHDATVESLSQLEHLERLELTSGCRLSSKGWRQLSGMKRLRSLKVEFGTTATVRDLELHRFAHLTSLSLSGVTVTDEGVVGLRGNKNLKTLRIECCEMSDASAQVIGSATGLEELFVSETHVGDAGVAALAALTHLRALDLRGTRVTDAALKTVAGWGALESLNLSQTAVTDTGIAHLRGLRQLRLLNLACPAVTDASAPALAQLAALEWLNLHETQLSSAGLRQLAGLKNLTRFYTPHMSAQDEAELKEAMPGCRINDYTR